MPIINYANRINPTKVRIDQNKPPKSKSYTGGGDINDTVNNRIYHDSPWKIKNINLGFSSENAKDFSISILNGMTVVYDRNDYIWVKLIDESIKFSTFHKKIVLMPGFYTGAELATELQNKLDEAFDDYSVTFSVTYSDVTGLFSIEPSAYNIKYLQINPVMPHTKKDSIGGILFGLTEDNTPSAVLTSDTPVYGLNGLYYIAFEEASTSSSYINNDEFKLSMDQALSIESSSGDNINLSYNINCEIED